MVELQRWEIDFSAPRSKEGARLLAFGRVSEATAIFQAAVEEAPESPAARYNLAIVHQAGRKIDLARAGYREALRLDPGYEKAAKQLKVLEEGADA
jgi:Tfp pilus assembly protein PilF